MAEHTLKRFDEELERLSSTISEMGGLAESQLAQCLVALRQNDSEAAERVIADDARVDALDSAVQEQTVKLLALRQPMAVDLRVILSSIKIAAALERIAELPIDRLIIPHGAVLEPGGAAHLRAAVAEARRG